MKLKWAFCFVASAVWFVGAVWLPHKWLADHAAVRQAIDYLSVFQNAFGTAAVASGVIFAAVFVYTFTVLPTERQQSFLVACIPLVVGLGLIIGTGTPVRSEGICGQRHSIVPLVSAPIFLKDPHTRSRFLTYEFDDFDRSECD
jgi:hypothetical protein